MTKSPSRCAHCNRSLDEHQYATDHCPLNYHGGKFSTVDKFTPSEKTYMVSFTCHCGRTELVHKSSLASKVHCRECYNALATASSNKSKERPEYRTRRTQNHRARRNIIEARKIF